MAEKETTQQIYHRYLKSEIWRHFRQVAILRNKRKNDGYLLCDDCKKHIQKTTDVHHLQYCESNDYWMDDCSDWHICLCRECHEIRHGKDDDNMMYVPPKPIEKSYLATYFCFMIKYHEKIGEFMDFIAGDDLGDFKHAFELLKPLYEVHKGDLEEYFYNNIDSFDIDEKIKDILLLAKKDNQLKIFDEQEDIKLKLSGMINMSDDNPFANLIYNETKDHLEKLHAKNQSLIDMIFKDILKGIKARRRNNGN